MPILAIAILVAAPILFVVGLVVRFAGAAKALNLVDYSKINDPAALHCWAGNRLLVLAFATAVLGVAALAAPSFSILFLVVFVSMVMLMAIRLALGSSRFQLAASQSFKGT